MDETKCTRCGQCVRDCVSKIITRNGSEIPRIRSEDEANCIGCQHCLAVCPEAAVSIFGLRPADSQPLKEDSFPALDKMLTLARGRRSVRQYRDENVEQGLQRQLLEALGNAPTGVNRRALTFAVIDDRDAMRRFRAKTYDMIADAIKSGQVPGHHAGFLQEAAAAWREKGVDTIFRGAPHMLVVFAGSDAVCPQEDVTLALAYFELTAQSAGLGTLWCGLAKWAMEAVPELKDAAGIPPDSNYYVMLFGVPAVRYPRAVQRDGAARVRRISV
ncbi:MAG: nitroreductase family protein [Kiritimatiellae bacterium]|nr:nitroreductase family protein [Kiritimatiellia bacterium]